MAISRRSATLLLGAIPALLARSARAGAAKSDPATPLQVYDPVTTELVMNLVVTCTGPERPGPAAQGPDGTRDEIWPIVGGRFWGKDIRGEVIPGGGDFPVTRPDGVVWVDALYRLRTDDGVQIVIHNQGMGYTEDKYRLAPTFTVTAGKYDWLNKFMFVATLVYPPPEGMRLAKGPKENDRLIQVFRIA